MAISNEERTRVAKALWRQSSVGRNLNDVAADYVWDSLGEFDHHYYGTMAEIAITALDRPVGMGKPAPSLWAKFLSWIGLT